MGRERWGEKEGERMGMEMRNGIGKWEMGSGKVELGFVIYIVIKVAKMSCIEQKTTTRHRQNASTQGLPPCGSFEQAMTPSKVRQMPRFVRHRNATSRVLLSYVRFVTHHHITTLTREGGSGRSHTMHANLQRKHNRKQYLKTTIK